MAEVMVRRHKHIPCPDEWTTGQKQLVQVVFVCLGVSCLAIWGGLLNMLHDLEHIVYPGYTLGDTLLATTMTTVLIMTCTWITLDRVSITLVYASCVGITCCCFIIAIVVAFVPGQAGVVCLHFVGLLIGVFKGTLYPMSFGLANVMPVDKGGACAVGLGLAGVYSLLLYLTLTVWGFTVTTYEELMPPFWIFCTLLSLPSMIGPVILYYILHQEWIYGNMGPKICERLHLPVLDPNAGDEEKASKPIALSGSVDPTEKPIGGTGSQVGTSVGEVATASDGAKTATADEIEDPAELAKMQAWAALSSSEKVRQLMADCWKPMFSIWFVFFVTLQLYPNVGPLAFNDGRINALYMMAAFQGLEYFARAAQDKWNWQPFRGKAAAKTVEDGEEPAQTGWGFRPFAIFAPFGLNWLLGLVLVRVVFIPLFVLCMIWPDHSFWGALWWHYVIVGACGFTLGWGGNLAVYHAPNCLGPDKPKTLRMQAGQSMVLFANFGIWIALWIGKLYFL